MGVEAVGWTDVKRVRDLKGPLDLSAERKREPQYFHMETQYIHIGFDGKRTGTETYKVELRCVPGVNRDEYACSEFGLDLGDGQARTIPALRDWSYVFDPTLSGTDERGPLWGIAQNNFASIVDSLGNALPFSIRYAVYNNFIDFHSLNDFFARPMRFGKGIQDLKTLGQRIVHAAAFTSGPVKFGAEFKEGSFFRHGEATLELKGISLVDGVPCAIVAYDSGESTLKMIMPFGAGQESTTEGGSEYKGDIYIDLATLWLRKATLDEYVVTETSVPDHATKIDGYTVRHILLRQARASDT